MDVSTEALTPNGPQRSAPAAGFEVPGSGLAAVVADVSARVSEALAPLLPGSGGPEVLTPEGAVATPKELLEVAGRLEALARVVGAAQVAVAGRVGGACLADLGDASLAAELGCRSAVDLLRHVTRAGSRELARRVKLADRVLPRRSFTGEAIAPSAPEVGAAMARGDLSVACASGIVSMLQECSGTAQPEVLEVAERALVEEATGAEDALPQHDDSMRVRCQAWHSILDQDGAEPDDDVPLAQRGLWIGPVRDGTVSIRGRMLPEPAAVLGRLLDAMNAPAVQRRGVRFEPVDDPANADAGSRSESADTGGAATADHAGAAQLLRTADRADAHDRADTHDRADANDRADADGALPPGALPAMATRDERRPEQRRHDALAALLAIVAQRPEVPNLGGAPVTVMVQVAEEALHEGRGAGWLHGADGEPVPISQQAVRHAACSGAVQRVAQGADGRIIGLGSPSRIFTAHQRRAIMVRDAGCVIPGCTVPATWCEVHHVQEWSRGGPTHTDNGVLVCWYHHRTLERSGWEIRMRGGTPEVRPPEWIDLRRRWYRTRSPLQPPGSASAASRGGPPRAASRRQSSLTAAELTGPPSSRSPSGETLPSEPRPSEPPSTLRPEPSERVHQEELPGAPQESPPEPSTSTWGVVATHTRAASPESPERTGARAVRTSTWGAPATPTGAVPADSQGRSETPAVRTSTWGVAATQESTRPHAA